MSNPGARHKRIRFPRARAVASMTGGEGRLVIVISLIIMLAAADTARVTHLHSTFSKPLAQCIVCCLNSIHRTLYSEISNNKISNFGVSFASRQCNVILFILSVFNASSSFKSQNFRSINCERLQ